MMEQEWVSCIAKNNLNTLKEAIPEKAPFIFNYVCFYNKNNSHDEILQWVIENTKEKPNNISLAFCALNNDLKNLQKLQKLYSIKVSFLVVYYALKVENFEIMNWLYDNFDVFSSSAYIDVNDFRVLEWLKERGIKPEDKHLENAVYYSNFAVVKWLYDNGCRITKKALDYSVLNGDSQILEWIYENSKLRCDEYLLREAITEDYLYIVKWLYQQHGTQLKPKRIHGSVSLMRGTVISLELVKFLHENYNFLDYTEIDIKLFAKKGKYEVLEYLYKHCRESFDLAYYYIMRRMDDPCMLNWLYTDVDSQT